VIAAAVAYCLCVRRGRLHRRIEAIALEGVCVRGGIWITISISDSIIAQNFRLSILTLRIECGNCFGLSTIDFRTKSSWSKRGLVLL
jgi:hypothetical protein